MVGVCRPMYAVPLIDGELQRSRRASFIRGHRRARRWHTARLSERSLEVSHAAPASGSAACRHSQPVTTSQPYHRSGGAYSFGHAIFRMHFVAQLRLSLAYFPPAGALAFRSHRRGIALD